MTKFWVKNTRKNPIYACYIDPQSPNFRPVNSVMSHFQAMHSFQQSAPNDPKMTLTSSRSKIPKCFATTIFCQFCSMMSSFFELQSNIVKVQRTTLK